MTITVAILAQAPDLSTMPATHKRESLRLKGYRSSWMCGMKSTTQTFHATRAYVRGKCAPIFPFVLRTVSAPTWTSKRFLPVFRSAVPQLLVVVCHGVRASGAGSLVSLLCLAFLRSGRSFRAARLSVGLLPHLETVNVCTFERNAHTPLAPILSRLCLR